MTKAIKTEDTDIDELLPGKDSKHQMTGKDQKRGILGNSRTTISEPTNHAWKMEVNWPHTNESRHLHNNISGNPVCL